MAPLSMITDSGLETDLLFNHGVDLVDFAAPGGGRFAGVLRELGDTAAIFDFNHPLAGKALLFEVKLISVL